MKVALTGRWRKYEAKKSSSQALKAGVELMERAGRRQLSSGRSTQRRSWNERSTALIDFLDPRAVLEVALVALAALDDLVDEVLDQVGVEQRAPRLLGMPAGRVEARGDRQLLELDGVRGGDLDRLGDAALLDQPADDRAPASVEPGLDARVVADGDVARLDRADRAVGVLADEDVAVVDVHAHHPAGVAHHPLGDEVPHRADHSRVVGADPPVADVDDRGAIAFQGGGLEPRLVGGVIDLAERHLGIEPLRVLLVAVEDERGADEPLVDQRPGVLDAGAVAEGEAELGLEALRRASSAAQRVWRKS